MLFDIMMLKELIFMWFFGKKKKQKIAEQKRQEELARQAKIKEEKKLQEKEKEVAQAKSEPKANAPTAKKAPTKKAPAKKTAKKVEEDKKSPSGKYELYPEAGMYKYRLKASNGEILAVSFGYSSKAGAQAGLETFRKAVKQGNFEISTDKSNYSHYDLFGARSARVILTGEFYSTLKKAESAVESVKKFYQTDRVVELKSIPASEVREEIVPKQKVDQNANGKYQLVKDDEKSYFIKLVASNGQVLLVSQSYASKQSALNGLETIQNAIANQNFTISKDKQNRYQYNLYSNNKQLIVSGETYPVKQSCLSAIQSVLRFAEKAKFVEV